MSESLRDQLLKAGLVDSRKVKQVKAEEHKHKKQAPKKTAPPPDEAKRRAQQAQAEKAERDRRLNQARREAAEHQAMVAQIKQLVEGHAPPPGPNAVAYNFVHHNVVHTLLLPAEWRSRIVEGQACVVKAEDHYAAVPPEIADRIRQRDPTAVVIDNRVAAEEGSPADEDPYAAYRVPDDLMW